MTHPDPVAPPFDRGQVKRWVGAFRNGDMAGYETIVRSIQHRVVWYLRQRYVLTAEEACDLTNETLTTAWGGLRTGVHVDQPEAWLFGIACHHAGEHLQRIGLDPQGCSGETSLGTAGRGDRGQTMDDQALEAFWRVEDAVDREYAAKWDLPRLLPLTDDAVDSLPQRLREVIHARAGSPGSSGGDLRRAATIDSLVTTLDVDRSEASRLLFEASECVRKVAGALLIASDQRQRCGGFARHLQRAGWRGGPFTDALRHCLLKHVATCHSCRPVHQRAIRHINRLPLAALALALGLRERRHRFVAGAFAGDNACTGSPTVAAQAAVATAGMAVDEQTGAVAAETVVGWPTRLGRIPGVRTVRTAATQHPVATQWTAAAVVSVAAGALALTAAATLVPSVSTAEPPSRRPATTAEHDRQPAASSGGGPEGEASATGTGPRSLPAPPPGTATSRAGRTRQLGTAEAQPAQPETAKPAPERQPGTVVGWGQQAEAVPAGLSGVTAIAAGGQFNLALRGDGTVLGWGQQAEAVPLGLSGVTAVAAGGQYGLALRGDGTVLGWGQPAMTPPASLSGVAAIATGGQHSLALLGDGTVVAWGEDGSGQAKVPAGLSGVRAIAAGTGFSLALLANDSVVWWGAPAMVPPAGLTGVRSIAASGTTAVAVRGDGTVVTWGPSAAAAPAELTGVSLVSTNGTGCLAMRADGTLVAWGQPALNPPDGLAGVSAVAAGSTTGLALLK